MKNFIKTFAVFAILISLISCGSDDDSGGLFSIYVFNPYGFDVELVSSQIEATNIPYFEGQTLTGNAGTGSLYGREAGCQDDCMILGDQGDYSDGVREFTFEAGKEYFWVVGENFITESSTGDGGSGLQGKWVREDGCVNANGEQTYFYFGSDGTGRLFQADCNNACDGFGVYLYFDYTDNGDSVTLNYTGNNTYCGVETAIPDPDTLDYELNGDELDIAGALFIKE